jgi:hypothetical protein
MEPLYAAQTHTDREWLQRWALEDERSHEAPTVTNLAGGKQSQVLRDYTLVPINALAQVARVMYNGLRKYTKDNWKSISCNDHINHALNHVYLHLAGNTHEDHLAHATTRMMMALESQLTDNHDNTNNHGD